MKLTNEILKNKIECVFGSGDWQPKDQCKLGNNILRTFSDGTRKIMVLTEPEDTAIISLFLDTALDVGSSVPANKYLCYIYRDFTYNSHKKDLLVAINLMSYWKQKHCLADTYSTSQWKEFEDARHKLKLQEVRDSTFSCSQKISKEKLKTQMINLGFVFDPEFDKFMKNPA